MPQTLLILVIVTALLGLAAAEVLSLVLDNRHVAVRCEVNMRLTEPDETVTLTYRVRNTGFWPLFFVGFSFLFDDGVEIRESEDWKAAHHVGSLFGKMYSFDVGLLPHRVLRGSVRFSFRERGLHSLGRVYVETGDFLGFRSRVRSFEIPGSLVCTARSLPEAPELAPLGGFLGDISVRRFILEDPSLVLGYRDYTGAEPMKQISWTQTARTGRLTVKNHDFTADADAAILVDVEACKKPVAERCLSLARTVSDRLEAARIPYAVLSNGDLFEIRKGVGRTHRFEVQRRIGLSRFVRYRRFDELVNQCVRSGVGRRVWIVIAPQSDPALGEALARLQASSDMPLCLLIGEEATDRA
jgi:uncharacterized protein (DUF58 family)